MSAIAESGKAVARAAAAAFGGAPRVDRFYDEDESHSVDQMTCDGRPMAGFTTYSTLTIHTVPNLLDDADVRIEMAGVAGDHVATFPNMIASAAFRVIVDRWLCAPGVVFQGLVSEYDLSSTLQHILWVPPFPWEQLGAVELGDELAVHWLLAVPISEAERTFLNEHGYNVFEALMADRQVEYFDLERPSIV
jgi:hypothetical protein